MKVAQRDIPCHKHIELPVQFVADAVAGLPMRAALPHWLLYTPPAFPHPLTPAARIGGGVHRFGSL